MTLTETPKCATCRFFRTPEEHVTEDGRCHRRSPVASHGSYSWAIWPWVTPDEWCGEHEATDVDKP